MNTKNTKNTAQVLAHAASIGILCYSTGHPVASSLAQLSRKILEGSIVPAKSACGFRASAETANAAKAAHVLALIASNDAGQGATLWRKQSREFNALVLEAWGVDAKTRKRKACSVAWEEITPAAKAAKVTRPAVTVGDLVKAAQAKTSTHATPPPYTPIAKAAKAAKAPGIDAMRAQVERITAEIAKAEAQAEAQAKAAKAAQAKAAKAEAAAQAAAQAEATKRDQLAEAVHVQDQDIQRMISDLATLAPYGVAPENAHLQFVLSGRKVSIPLPGDDVASLLGLLA